MVKKYLHGILWFVGLILIVGAIAGYCVFLDSQQRRQIDRKDELLAKARLRLECGEVRREVLEQQRDAERRARIER